MNHVDYGYLAALAAIRAAGARAAVIRYERPFMLKETIVRICESTILDFQVQKEDRRRPRGAVR